MSFKPRKLFAPVRKIVHFAADKGVRATEFGTGALMAIGQPELAVPFAAGGAQITGGAKILDSILN
jgi:hypothetical protein